MTVRIEKVDLPGIGTRHDVLTEAGRRVGVIALRDGQRNLALYDIDDPDACRESIKLTDDEAAALADVLGASVMMSQLTGIGEQATGLFTEQLVLPADSPYVGGVLGDTKARTRTGTSIVAIARDGQIEPSPSPTAPLHSGDTVVAVGTREGLDALAELLTHGAG
ncbi:cation:proton antiporter regulatory subunit [Amnibacterium flavum]|uniref:Potassium transporter TrkA n=1 Tax=Amnibacterium flavum TaxID=2173173 RepID=A0A2V1HTS5_9MICO|nr:cation:proton antiporter regulatory subunit [Amnibacterium flavum]PVZ95721.1 potassium transporter TrkA [Amnibacterium flavum]